MSALDSIRQRAENATPGPWRIYDGRRDNRDAAVETAWSHDEDGADTELITDWCKPEDAEFIAAARTDIPRLLAALDAVEALCASVPDVQGHDCKFEGILLPSQVRTAITQALGEDQ